MKEMDDFVAIARAGGRKIVFVARGGETANNKLVASHSDAEGSLPLEDRDTAVELLSIVDYGLAIRLAESVAVIAAGAAGSQVKKVKDNIFNVPRTAIDFSRILPKVDLVIHHGTCSQRGVAYSLC